MRPFERNNKFEARVPALLWYHRIITQSPFYKMLQHVLILQVFAHGAGCCPQDADTIVSNKLHVLMFRPCFAIGRGCACSDPSFVEQASTNAQRILRTFKQAKFVICALPWNDPTFGRHYIELSHGECSHVSSELSCRPQSYFTRAQDRTLLWTVFFQNRIRKRNIFTFPSLLSLAWTVFTC